MKRIFGAKNNKEPPPSIQDASDRINKRGESVEDKVKRLDAELCKYKDQIKRTRPGPAQEAIKARAVRVLKQKKMYEGQRDMLYNQTFNLDQVSFAAEGLKDAQQTMTALKSANKELKGMMKTVKIQDIDNLQDEMMDLMDVSSEIQDSLGRSYNVPDDIDEDDLMGELDALEADMGNETEADGVPSSPFLISSVFEFVVKLRKHRHTSSVCLSSMALLKSFVDVTPDSHFPIQNLPYGVFKPDSNSTPRPAVAIGDSVVDLSAISEAGLFDGPILNGSDCFLQPSLNKFLAMGRPAWKEARSTLQRLLSSTEPSLRDNDVLRRKSFYEMSKVEMVVPMVIGDYTDFFASMHHAKNCGLMFRGPQNAINPNWFRLPIAYHGRASSIVISGTDIIRPRGQGHPQGDSEPYFGPSKKLDFELEMAAVVGPGNELGKPIDVNNAADHIFGLVLMNDWSARDIQAWEYVPLGPFLGKSFGTTVSPWIVTLDALEPFSCQAPKQDPPPLPYLTEKESVNYDISLEVQLKPSGKDESSVITKSNFQNLYWTITQQLAHHTVNGCNLRPGDLLGTGTISGPEPDSYGCLLELTWNGQKPLSMNGTTQTFLQDGDQVTFSGVCKGDGYNIGFGTCIGKILPSLP